MRQMASAPAERWRKWGLQDLAEVKSRSPERAEDNEKFPQGGNATVAVENLPGGGAQFTLCFRLAT